MFPRLSCEIHLIQLHHPNQERKKLNLEKEANKHSLITNHRVPIVFGESQDYPGILRQGHTESPQGRLQVIGHP